MQPVWSSTLKRGLWVALFLVSLPARAAVIFDSFDLGGGFDTSQAAVAAGAFYTLPPFQFEAWRAAAEFTVTGSSYSLDSVTLPISANLSPYATNVLEVLLTADAAGAPGATLEVLSQDAAWPAIGAPFTTATTLDSTGHPLLANGASYWIVTELTEVPISNVDYRWFYNTSAIDVPARQQQAIQALPSDPWPGSPSSQPLAFEVDGTRVPEPSAALVIASSLLALAGVGLARLRH